MGRQMPLFSIPDLQLTLNASRKYSRRATQFSHDALFESQETYPDDFKFDVFLSHSYLDATMNKAAMLALQAELESFGLTVYVDWIIDRQLDRSQVTKQTARKLRRRMDHCQCLFFATSANSQRSRWMPWELGYMDGRCGRVAILPVALERHRTTFVGNLSVNIGK
jgi:hypothetical protein